MVKVESAPLSFHPSPSAINILAHIFRELSSPRPSPLVGSQLRLDTLSPSKSLTLADSPGLTSPAVARSSPSLLTHSLFHSVPRQQLLVDSLASSWLSSTVTVLLPSIQITFDDSLLVSTSPPTSLPSRPNTSSSASSGLSLISLITALFRNVFLFVFCLVPSSYLGCASSPRD